MDVWVGTVDGMTEEKVRMDRTERKIMGKDPNTCKTEIQGWLCKSNKEKKREKIQAGCGYVGYVYVLCFARSSLCEPGGQAPGACHLGLFQVVKA